ncbi:MAG TPA: VOC family protein [Chitinophagaceae bacterium]
MQKLRKIDSATNIINWFEIPVTDTERAKRFYETILDIQMQTLTVSETNEELTFFPYNPEVVQATSGRVTGALVKSGNRKPSDKGTTVYINASPDIQMVLDKVTAAGGKIIVSKKQIRAGFIAMILDTEGNSIGLHAEK